MTSCCIFLTDQLFGRNVRTVMFSPFFSVTWKCSFKCGIISPSIEMFLPLKSVKLYVFFSWLLQIILNFFFWLLYLWQPFSEFPQSLVQTMWVCSILKLFKTTFSFMSYSELEETGASYTKLLCSFAIYCLHLSQIPYPFWIFGTFIVQLTQISGFSWNLHHDWHSRDYDTVF